MLLAGDIGGTKTVLAVFDPARGIDTPLAERTFPSGQYPSLQALVRDFVATVDHPLDRACFGVAGPVIGGQAAVTNLPWMITEAQLRETLELSSVTLLNDLEATAYAVPSLPPEGRLTLNQGIAMPGGPVAVLAPGTGLGEAFLTANGGRYYAHSSEGGHADFAPNGLLQSELLLFLQSELGHVSYERVCSGRGLPNLYRFLRAVNYAPETTWVAKQLATAPDPTPVIVEAALGGAACPLCVGALELFVEILGAKAGNLALTLLSTGGVYLGGGIPPRILPALQHPRFLAAFRNKGRFADLLATFPVHVILHSRTALLGAACYGMARYVVG